MRAQSVCFGGGVELFWRGILEGAVCGIWLRGVLPDLFRVCMCGRGGWCLCAIDERSGRGNGHFQGASVCGAGEGVIFEDGEWGERVVAKKVGEYCLGDRWVGEVKVKGNSVFIYTEGYQCMPEEKPGWSVVDLTQDWELGNKIDKA